MRTFLRAALADLSAIALCPSALPQAISTRLVDTGLEKIVVAASRRVEDLQKSSLAIQVLSANEPKNACVTDAKGLSLLVPGLQIGMAGPDTQIYIRGVGDFGRNALANPAVVTNVDGVYMSRPAAVAGRFYDL
jgi:iron complex outermembrane recepter protein